MTSSQPPVQPPSQPSSGRAPNESRAGKSWTVGDTVKLVIILLLAFLLIAFIVDNTATVRVGFVFFDGNIALIWVLLATALIGAVIGWFVHWRISKRNANAKSRRTK